MEKSTALSWDELADIYDKSGGRRGARTLPMETVFKWAERQKDKFYVDPKVKTIHLKGEK